MTQNFQAAYQRLNPEQKKAVDTIYGPVSVIAGPGTGKTQLLTLRIANIIQKSDCHPKNILALTFTEAGAFAMRDRLRTFIGTTAYQVHIATFHGFCNDIILSYPEIFQFSKNLQAIEELEKNKCIGSFFLEKKWKHLWNRHDPEMYLFDAIRNISQLKRENISPQDYRNFLDADEKNLEYDPSLFYKRKSGKNNVGDKKPSFFQKERQIFKQRELADIYEMYENHLKKIGKYDFEDMIRFVGNTLRENEQFRAEIQEKYQFLLVDEYQDTNTSQNNILKYLTQDIEQPNILVVGDDEQSIYRFQGAVMENMLDFHTTFSNQGITTITLKTNYRSTQNILDASRELIRNNTVSLEKELNLDKQLLAFKKENEKILIHTPEDENLENYFITQEIKKYLDQGVSPSEIAIIYRKNSDALEIMEWLKRADIPFRKQKWENLFHHPEARKLIKTLKSIHTISDEELLWDVLLFDFFKLDILHVLRVQNTARDPETKKPFWETLLEMEDEQISPIIKMFISLNHARVNKSLVEFFEDFLETSGYRKYVFSCEDVLDRLNVMNSFFNEIKKYTSTHPEADIKDFIEYCEDLLKYNLAPKTQPLKTHTNAVELMTAHGSKGLEFEIVFIYRANSKSWEKSRNPSKIPVSVDFFEQKNPEGIDEKSIQTEEDRRLFYVAMTRAKKHLHISSLKSEESKIFPSQFIYEIPEKMTEPVVCENVKKVDLLSQATQPPVKIDMHEALKAELQQRIKKYSLSVTHLNTWLKSPHEFLIRHLMRKPSSKPYSASLGTIVHEWLSYISNFIQKENTLPSKAELKNILTFTAKKEILTSIQKEKILEESMEILEKYISCPTCPLQTPGSSEILLGKNPMVTIENLPIQGKIDKIEKISDLEIQVVDFKTGKSKKSPEASADYERQLYFYKLLWDGSGKSEVLTHGILDFVEDTENGITRKTYEFEPEKIELLKNQIKRFKKSLDELDFPEEPFGDY